MSKIQLFHNTRCSKSNNAVCFLNDHGMNEQVEIIRYLEDAPSKETIETLVNSLSKEHQLIDLIRVADAKKIGIEIPSNVTSKWVIDTLITEPKVMQRPIIFKDGVTIIGRSDEALNNLLQ